MNYNSDVSFSFNFAVFHVTDLNGNKLTDESVSGCIEQVIITTVNVVLKKVNLVIVEDFTDCRNGIRMMY